MINLPVDVNSSEWMHVKRYADARIAEMAETCTNPTLSEYERLQAAVRADELRVLLAAPALTQRLTAQRADTTPPTATY